MKTLSKFKSFELPNEVLKFLKGGQMLECANPGAFEGCAATAERDGNYWLISTCWDVLC